MATLAITALLESVEADIVAHPERIRISGGAMHDRLKALVGDTNVDLELPLSPDDERRELRMPNSNWSRVMDSQKF